MRLLMLAPICFWLGCASTVTYEHWYTCEFLCYGKKGVKEARSDALGATGSCLCINGEAYPYIKGDDAELEKLFNKDVK